ncbi:hypothetical protein OY671_003317 [Metschnikowia pulcherrima]|nr:hypothetical protein OY671_003317 [Metschnikowia pulcherrima]
MLKDQLADINFSAHTQTLSSEKSAQLKFAKHLFQVMEDASIENAKSLTMNSQNSADPVAYKSIVLNIRALVLHDMYGKPGLQMRDYEKKVHELSSDIYDMRSSFENHITEAEITIESLVKQME